MNQTIKQPIRIVLLTLAVALGGGATRADPYQVGDVVTNFSFIARREFTRPDGTLVPAGARVHLHDFPGHVVFFEWFAVWCPFCQAAVPQVQTGIADWYASRGGNPYGVPVLHILVNQEPASYWQASTDDFIDQYGLEIVVNDYDSNSVNTVRFMFQSANQQPIFAVINTVTNSPSHQAWECLVNHLGYGETDFSQELANFRAIIDTVQAPPPPLVIEEAHFENADFVFHFETQPERTYQVQGSANGVQWITLDTRDGTAGTVTFRHTNAPPGHTFYRVTSP